MLAPAARRGLQLLIVAAVLWVLGQVVVTLSAVLIPIAVALLVAALVAPGADLLTRHRVPRPLATAVVLLVGLAAVGGLVTFAVISVAGSLPDLQAQLTDSLAQLGGMLAGLGVNVPPLDQLVTQARDWLGGNVGQLTTAFSTLGAFLTGLLLALFVLVFLVLDGERIWNYLLKAVPEARRDTTDQAGRSAWGTVTQYVRATVLVALIDAVVIGIGLWVLGVPLVIPLAALTFLGAFVPLVGAFASGAVAVLVAFLANGFTTALIVLAIIVVVQQLEGNVLQPLLQGNAVRLHPLAIVLAVTIGINQAGIVGAVLAVPLLAAIKSAAETVVAHRRPAAPDRAGHDGQAPCAEPGPGPADATPARESDDAAGRAQA